MIRIEGTRFGVVEVGDEAVIDFPNGLVGFPAETQFVLLERGDGRPVGYLQSTRTPTIAFPVTEGSHFQGYPDPPVEELARGAGLPEADLVILVIVAANAKTRALEANMLAPLLVDANGRVGVQVVLDSRKFSATTSLADPIAAVKARIEAIRRKQAAEATVPSEPHAPAPAEHEELAAVVGL